MIKYLFDEPKRKKNKPWNANKGWIVNATGKIPVEPNRNVECYVTNDLLPHSTYYDSGAASNFQWDFDSRYSVIAFKVGGLWNM